MKKKASRSAASKKIRVTDTVGPATNPYRESHHVSVRKIDNGYVTSHSGYKGDKHYEREMYHPKKPSIQLTGSAAQMEKKIGKSKV